MSDNSPVEGPLAQAQPALRVVRGTPTPEELAALVGVLFSRRPTAEQRPSAPSSWVTLARPGNGRPWRPGPGAWRHSGLPT